MQPGQFQTTTNGLVHLGAVRARRVEHRRFHDSADTSRDKLLEQTTASQTHNAQLTSWRHRTAATKQGLYLFVERGLEQVPSQEVPVRHPLRDALHQLRREQLLR